MLSILLGFAAPFLKPIIKIFQSKVDNKHEKAMLALQLEADKVRHTNKIQEMVIDGDIRRTEGLLKHDAEVAKHASTWIHNLRASVRPIITYLFFAVFATVEVTALLTLMDAGDAFGTSLLLVWDTPEQELFGAIMGFWFGGRYLEKAYGSKNN